MHSFRIKNNTKSKRRKRFNETRRRNRSVVSLHANQILSESTGGSENSNCNREISYFERKKQDPNKAVCILNKEGISALVKQHRTSQLLQASGLEYIATNPVFNVIETSLYPQKHLSETNQEITYSFLYIISKNIGEQLFFKFGSGGNFKRSSQGVSLNRIEGAQTFLIPGIGNNTGFSIHFLFFYKNVPHIYKSQPVHEFIEKSIHRILQIQFKAANLKFGTESATEWYLLRKANKTSDDPKYFCGVLIDILTTYANHASALAPKVVWKLSEVSNHNKIVTLPLRDDARNRLADSSGIYNKVLSMLRSKGFKLDNPFNVQIEEGDENTLKKKKGSVKMYREQIIDKGLRLVKEVGSGKVIGNIFDFKNKAYLLTEIKFNQIKYSFGQPLESSEIYVKFKPYEHDDMAIAEFENAGFRIISKYDKQTDNNEYVYSDYYMKIEDYLRLTKPLDEDMPNWAFKENYEYYEMRKKGKNYEVFEMSNNLELPQWYFNPNVQEFWSKVFSGTTSNDKFKDYQKEHTDTRVSVKSDTKKYKWKITARIIYKIDKDSKRSNILLKRSTTTLETTIEEEIPVTRLMMLFNVSENVNETKIPQKQINHGKYSIEKDFTCRLPENYFDQDFEPNENVTKEICTYRVIDVYQRQLFQAGAKIEDENYMEIGEIFPSMYTKTYHVPIAKFPVEKKMVVIEKSFLTQGQILQFKQGKNSRLTHKTRPEDNYGKKEKELFYSLRDVKYLGLGTGVDKNVDQYVQVVSVMTEEENIYKLQYLPQPYDTVRIWPFPYNGEKVEKKFYNGNHTGIVTNVEPYEDKTVVDKENLYTVVYEDYEVEDYYLPELKNIMINKGKKHTDADIPVFHYVYASDLDKYIETKNFVVIQDKSLIEKLKTKTTKKKTRSTKPRTRKANKLLLT